MPSTPAATGTPFRFTPFPFGPPPQPMVAAPVTPSYTGTAPAGTQLFYSSAQFQTTIAADNGSTLSIGALPPVAALPVQAPAGVGDGEPGSRHHHLGSDRERAVHVHGRVAGL